MVDYAKLAATTSRVIGEFGARCVLRRQQNASYDVASSLIEGSERIWDGKALRKENEITTDGNGRRIVLVTLLLDARAFPTPVMADRLVFEGLTYEVTSIKPLAPAAIAVFHEVKAKA